MDQFKKYFPFLFKKKVINKPFARKRLAIIYKIETDKAIYCIYNTETTPKDWVNIEIERQTRNNWEIILKEELFEDSWNTMGGVAFNSLVKDAINHTKKYIINNKEFTLYELNMMHDYGNQ